MRTSAARPELTTGSAYDTTADTAGLYDLFVTKLSPDGASLLYSTYLNSSDWSESWAIAADDGGYAYITGFTSYTSGLDDFPTTANGYQTAGGGGQDAFVSVIDTGSSGSASHEDPQRADGVAANPENHPPAN